MAYVVSGIGFLAGGVIFKERLSVSGLNTAATLWCTAAIGALVGFGFFWNALIGVAAVLTANVVLRPIVRQINRTPVDENAEQLVSYEVRAVCREDAEERVRGVMIAAIRAAEILLVAVYSDDLQDQRVEVTADVTVAGTADTKLEHIVTALGLQTGVGSVSWRLVPTTEDESAIAAQE